MPSLTLDKIKSGMVVTEKVENDKGMVLLPPGTKLNEVLIERLKKWNVQRVTCEAVGDVGSVKPKEFIKKPEMNSEVENHLKDRFKAVKDDPIMSEIFNALKIYFQEASQEEE